MLGIEELQEEVNPTLEYRGPGWWQNSIQGQDGFGEERSLQISKRQRLQPTISFVRIMSYQQQSAGIWIAKIIS